MSNDPRKIGVLVPSADMVTEPNFQQFLPKGVVYYASRSYEGNLKEINNERLNKIIDGADIAAAALAHAHPELILFCCTAASFIRGPGWDKELSGRLSKAAGGIPATTTSSALLEAFGALRARSMYMITPYPEDRNQVEIKFFESNGIQVKGHDYFVCKIGDDIPAITPQQVVEMARKHKSEIQKCDALFFSCTNLRSMQVAEQIEDEIGVPVVTSNQSTVWLALGRLGVDASGVRAGRLFRTPYPKAQARVA